MTENAKEGKSTKIASWGFLQDEMRQHSKERVTMADSVETQGVDLRTRDKKLGAKGKARRKKCKVRFSIIKKNKTFQKNYMKVVSTSCCMRARSQQGPGESRSGDGSHGEVEIEETHGTSSSRQE